MTFGSKLQSLRESHGLSQKELANLIDVTTGVVAEWEADEACPNIAELARLSKALNVSADVLLDAKAEDIPVSVAPPKQSTIPIVTTSRKRKKVGWIVGALAIVATAVAVVLLLGILRGDKTPSNGGEPTPSKPIGTSVAPTDPSSDATVPTQPLAFSDDTSAIEEADASVVKIFCYDYEGELAATGSGFIAFNGKTVITNYHVMTSAYTCKISTNQDITYVVSNILCYSKEKDIAILQLEKNTGLQPLTLGDSSTIKKGERVVAIGSPLGIKNAVSTGVLSGRVMEGSMDVLQFTAPISSGSSGGALFDDRGNVIGITYASYIDGQNLNLAIPIELAVALYNARGAAKNVSAIHTNEHPYITKLVQYNGLPEVSIDELLSNPEAYDGKQIKLYGYLSSRHSYWSDPEWAKYSDYFTPHWKHLIYITSKAYVSGDGAFDNEMFEKASLGSVKYCYFQILNMDESRIFVDDAVLPGQAICWIGKISYWKNANGSIYFNGSTSLCFSLD